MIYDYDYLEKEGSNDFKRITFKKLSDNIEIKIVNTNGNKETRFLMDKDISARFIDWVLTSYDLEIKRYKNNVDGKAVDGLFDMYDHIVAFFKKGKR
ncbi:MAG: hypothetical protein WC783_02950 [Candidatus Paceibacterota bacterium]|jgi:hypothetical protein